MLGRALHLVFRGRAAVRLYRRQSWAIKNFPAFRLGYGAALDDIERTGLIPRDKEMRRRMADRALEKISTGQKGVC
jgi:hypothetical protein